MGSDVPPVRIFFAVCKPNHTFLLLFIETIANKSFSTPNGVKNDGSAMASKSNFGLL